MISVIIVNYLSWAYLQNCLNSLASIPNLEIIVVDNASNDGELQQFQKQYTKVIWKPSTINLGFGGACNLGASLATQEYLLFLNPDTEAKESAISNMLAFLKNNKSYKIVSCQQHAQLKKHFLFLPKLITVLGLFRSLYFGFVSKNFAIKTDNNNLQYIEPQWVSGSVVMISKQWFKTINGWSKDYWMYSEDADICKKTVAMGGKIALLTDAHIFHKHGGATRKTSEITAMAKTEVIISKHVYIQKHFVGLNKYLGHLFMILGTLIEKLPLAIVGILLFFIPKLKAQTLLFFNILYYYKSVFINRIWTSPKLKQ